MQGNTNMNQPDEEIWVFGYHAEDLITEIDLTRFDRQGIIKFHEGELLLKMDSELKVFHDDYCYIYNILFEGKSVPDIKTISGVNYYTIKGGNKYDLKELPEKKYLRDTEFLERSNKDNTLVIPCKSKSWGGGGLTLSLTLRALSPDRITKIRYLDVTFDKPVEHLLSTLEKTYKNKNNKNPKREVIDIISKYAAEDCLEVFLKKKYIDCDFISTKNDQDKALKAQRTNLILSSVTDGITTVGDRIIFRCPVPKDILDKSSDEISSQIFESSQGYKTITIALNTVKHYDFFTAVLGAYSKLYKSKSSKEKPKIIIMFTDDNREHFKKLKKYNRNLYKEVFRNMNCIFNEKEFGLFARDIAGVSDNDANFLFAGDTPNLNKLVDIFIKFRRLGNPQRIYVTHGGYGSVGVDEYNRVVCVKTYPTRGVNIYDKTGCGDAWAGVIVLLEHHMKKLRAIKQRRMSRFMRIASGTAWAKMTSPSGTVKIEEVVSLLATNYIPWTIGGDAIIIEGGGPDSDKVTYGVLNRIEKASSINYKEYLTVICGWCDFFGD